MYGPILGVVRVESFRKGDLELHERPVIGGVGRECFRQKQQQIQMIYVFEELKQGQCDWSLGKVVVDDVRYVFLYQQSNP